MAVERSHPAAGARSRIAGYGNVAMLFHWLLALAIVTSFSVGLYMHDLPFSPMRVKLFNWHKWAGITILALSAARLLWRLRRRPPPLPSNVLATMPGWQRQAHHATHAALYLLFFAVPLSGWAYSSAAGLPIVWFGIVPLPDWVMVDKDFAAAFLKPLHVTFAFTLAAFVVLHVLATLKHQWIDRDGLFWRMWPRGATPRSQGS